MLLIHALSQLAILGATSIVLDDGRVVPFALADELLAKVAPDRRFRLCAREPYVDVVDDHNELFGRALTLWPADNRRGFEQEPGQIIATPLQAAGNARS